MSWLAIGALCCAAAIVAGAFGAHGLRARLTPEALEWWETGARYFLYAGLGLMLMGIGGGEPARRAAGLAPWSLFAGGLIFAGTLAVMALGGPRWLGAVTPVGGLLMIVGFVLFALSVR